VSVETTARRDSGAGFPNTMHGDCIECFPPPADWIEKHWTNNALTVNLVVAWISDGQIVMVRIARWVRG
jgi:hypothetical protein